MRRRISAGSTVDLSMFLDKYGKELMYSNV